MLVLVLLVGAAVTALLVWGTRPGPGSGKLVTISVPDGMTSAELAERLHAAGVIQHPAWMRLYFGFTRSSAPVPGEHLLNDALSPKELVQRLARLNNRPMRKVTIVEGWQRWQVAERLERLEICSSSSFLASARERALLDRLGVRGESAEGYLFPATYELLVDTSAASVIERLVSETRRRLARLDERHGAALDRLADTRGWGEHEVLTLASIVEKEAAVAEERRVIASVFFNRLSDPTFRPLRMLQSDPTAAYGCLDAPERATSCGNYRDKVLPAMLRDPDNRYNTYRHSGLPPGPIGNPGEAAIAAVLDPADTEYLYFVAKGQGRHSFSRTYAEHQEAVDRGRSKLSVD